MPVHYQLGARDGAEHVVLITLDRPEAKNSCDLEHFHQLTQAWTRFAAEDDAWVAIFTGVERCFMSGADLKTYVPEITALAKQIKAGEVDSVNGYSLSDGTNAVLRGTKIYKPIIAAVNGPVSTPPSACWNPPAACSPAAGQRCGYPARFRTPRRWSCCCAPTASMHSRPIGWA